MGVGSCWSGEQTDLLPALSSTRGPGRFCGQILLPEIPRLRLRPSIDDRCGYECRKRSHRITASPITLFSVCPSVRYFPAAEADSARLDLVDSTGEINPQIRIMRDDLRLIEERCLERRRDQRRFVLFSFLLTCRQQFVKPPPTSRRLLSI